MNDASDNSLELLRAKYDREIQEKEQEIAALRAKRALLVEVQQESKQLVSPESEPLRYRGMGATEAILDATKQLASVRGAEGITAAQVSQYLLAHGFQSNAASVSNLQILVSVTLKRLTESRRVASWTLGGRRFYKPIGRTLRFRERAGRRGAGEKTVNASH